MTNLLLILATMTCTVTGNLLLKLGANQNGFGATWPFSMINLNVILGASSFGLGLLFYTMLLKQLPLNIAQAIFSIQFVLVILASAFFFGEQIGWVRWGGIALVASGLLVIAWSFEPVIKV